MIFLDWVTEFRDFNEIWKGRSLQPSVQVLKKTSKLSEQVCTPVILTGFCQCALLRRQYSMLETGDFLSRWLRESRWLSDSGRLREPRRLGKSRGLCESRGLRGLREPGKFTEPREPEELGKQRKEHRNTEVLCKIV